jgi:hypothetical protein
MSHADETTPALFETEGVKRRRIGRPRPLLAKALAARIDTGCNTLEENRDSNRVLIERGNWTMQPLQPGKTKSPLPRPSAQEEG